MTTLAYLALSLLLASALGQGMPPDPIADGTIRIQESGLLEIYHNGVWGSICVSGFTVESAMTACREVHGEVQVESASFTSAKSIPELALGLEDPMWGTPANPIWLSYVECLIADIHIADCPSSGYDFPSDRCLHYEDVHVTCNLHVEGDIRRLDNGQLEILYGGIWGTICGRGFTEQSAMTACEELNGVDTVETAHFTTPQLTTSLATPAHGDLDSTYPIWTKDVACSSSDSRIGDCPHYEYGTMLPNTCIHIEDVYVTCDLYQEGDIRMKEDGLLEIFHDGIWGTICDDEFTVESAWVACTELFGAPHLKAAHFTSYIETTTLDPPSQVWANETYPIWKSTVVCAGTELRLDDCPSDVYADSPHGCIHLEDVFVTCDFSEEGDMRLTRDIAIPWGTGVVIIGRLEVFREEILAWLTVCMDNFTEEDGDLACKNLLGPDAALGRNDPSVTHTGTGNSLVNLQDCEAGSDPDGPLACDWEVAAETSTCYDGNDVWLICTVEPP